MPTLTWLNRAEALTLATRAPYRLLEPVPALGALKSLLPRVVEYKGAHLAGGPDAEEKQNIGELSKNRCVALSEVRRTCQGGYA